MNLEAVYSTRSIFYTCSQGTVVKGTMHKLFEGHRMKYIECINLDYKSTTKESFYGTFRFSFCFQMALVEASV